MFGLAEAGLVCEETKWSGERVGRCGTGRVASLEPVVAAGGGGGGGSVGGCGGADFCSGGPPEVGTGVFGGRTFPSTSPRTFAPAFAFALRGVAASSLTLGRVAALAS